MKRRNHDIHVNLGDHGSAPRPRRRPREAAADTSESPTTPLEAAARLRRAFQWEYRQLVWRLTDRSSSYRPWGRYAGLEAWVELIDKFREQKIVEPVYYVRWLFCDSGIALPHKDMMMIDPPLCRRGSEGQEHAQALSPATLADEYRLRDYHSAEKVAVQRALIRWRSSRHRAECNFSIAHRISKLSIEDATLRAICDSQLCPVFRYVLARSMVRDSAGSPEQQDYNERFRSVANEVRLPAYLTFLRYPKGYNDRSVTDDHLPASFGRAALACYDRLIAPQTEDEMETPQ